MKHSIKFKLAVIIMALVAGIILMICAFNALFLEKYYLNVQQKTIRQSFDSIRASIDGATIDREALDEVVRRVSNGQNIKLLIVDSNFDAVYGFKADMDMMLRWLKDYIFGKPSKNTKIIHQSDNYVIQTSRNTYDNQSYLELIGNDDDFMYNIIIQIPLESISKSVNISNRFFIIVGAASMLIGGIIAFLAAGQFSEPIMRLSSTAEAMAQMDFDVKYETKDKGEIGVLGNSINKMSDNLKHYISDLKAANLKLEKDIEKREELDRMRKDFVSNVSHELKTPIALIQGYAEGLKDGVTDDKESMEYYCDVIIDEAAKMNDMVKQLLVLDHLESGNDTLNIERFDIAGHIGEIVKANRIRAQQKNADIIYDYDGQAYVWADQFKIEEVVTNYISNAINHVEPVLGDKAYIKVSIDKADAGDGRLRVHVFNTGKNIPEDCLDKVWDKFYKIDKARTREYGGSGIGLSIVKAIMDSHGRSCGVRNIENGVDFWFDLDCENG